MKLPLQAVIYLFTTVLFFTTVVKAQYVPGTNNNVTLLGHLHDYQRYSNIWGYIDSTGNEYAIIGHNEGTSFINITDPVNPVEIAMVPGPAPSQGTIWREIKTYGNYAYVVSEHTSPNSLSGVQIIDISFLPDSVRYVGRYLWPGVDGSDARAHTVTVDSQGYLYIQGGTSTLTGQHQGGIRILSLADPENPTPVGVFDPRYVHDTFIQDSIMFAHNIQEFPGHIDIIDISDRSNPQLIVSHIYQNGFSHNSWITEDKNYLVSTDEQPGLTVKIWDISVLWDGDPNNNNEIDLVGEYISNTSAIAHEPRVRGNYVFVAHYTEGARVVDITNPEEPAEVGYYDTYPQSGQGFSGAWGIWPFFPSGNFVVSDIQTGLYVLRFDSLGAGGIEGMITDAISGQPLTNVRMRFVEADKIIFTDQSGNFSFRTNEGEHTIILTRFGYIGDTVTVNLPAGSNIVQNFTLNNNLARVSLSVDSITVYMGVDSIVNVDFEITNSGSAGVLVYMLDDIVGPPRVGESVSRNNINVLKNIKVSNHSNFNNKTQSKELNDFTYGLGDTVIVDPPGDLLFGTGGDIITVYALVNSESVTFTFEFLNPVDPDSTFLIFSLDTDFDVNTGAFPGGFGLNLPEQNIGSEFDILIDVPGLFSFPPVPRRYYIWEGANNEPSDPPAASGSIIADGHLVSLTIPFSQIGNDDGNMAIAGFGGHISLTVGVTSVDFVPDAGNGTVGNNPSADLPWLSLDPTSGNLSAGMSDIITATFDSHGLEKFNTYAGYIVVYSNDPTQPEISVPVRLITSDPLSADDDEQLPEKFELGQNYPNPFNPATIIPFSLSAQSNVKLKVYNIIGQEVITLLNKELSSGKYEITWNGKDNKGDEVVSGVYFYRIEIPGQNIGKKMILNR